MRPLDGSGACESCDKLARHQVRDLREVHSTFRPPEGAEMTDLYRNFRTEKVFYYCDDHVRKAKTAMMDGTLREG